MIPIGTILRKRAREQIRNESDNSAVKLSKLDDMIALLENDSDDDSYSSDSDRSSKSSDDEKGPSTIIIEERDETGHIVRLVSSNADDVIAPLPPHMLPLPMPKPKPKSTDREKKLASGSKERLVKFKDETVEPKTKIQSNERTATASALGSNPSSVSQGLETTIREMLKNYKPTSADRRPFWCRICCFQGENLQQWEEHKESEQHKLTGKIERKMSACRLCKKEFTSPDQLQEHIKGKAHKLAVENAKSRQEQARKYR